MNSKSYIIGKIKKSSEDEIRKLLEDDETGELVPEPEIKKSPMDWIRELKALQMEINFDEINDTSIKQYIGICHVLLDPWFKKYAKEIVTHRSAGKKSGQKRKTKSLRWEVKFQGFYQQKKKARQYRSSADIIQQFRNKHKNAPSATTLRKYLPK